MIRSDAQEVQSVDEVFQRANLDLTSLIIGGSDNVNLPYNFPLAPSVYLRYAKEDFKENTQRGLINSLSNAKRSIDCLVESTLRSLGINPKLSLNGQRFCNTILSDNEKTIEPASLRLFCALGFAPFFLISEVRLLRNKVEHSFISPDKESVTKALEVAELLINNVKAKELYSASIYITDRKTAMLNRVGR